MLCIFTNLKLVLVGLEDFENKVDQIAARGQGEGGATNGVTAAISDASAEGDWMTNLYHNYASSSNPDIPGVHQFNKNRLVPSGKCIEFKS